MKVKFMKLIAERLEHHGVEDVHVHRHRGARTPEDTLYSAYGNSSKNTSDEELSVKIEILGNEQIKESLTVTKKVENKLYQG